MKIIKDISKGRKRLVTVEIDDGEHVRAFKAEAFYILGEPMQDEIIAGHLIVDARPTRWCSIEQKWIS